VLYTELFQDPVHMIFCCAQVYRQLTGDLLVREPICHQQRYLTLTWGESRGA